MIDASVSLGNALATLIDAEVSSLFVNPRTADGPMVIITERVQSAGRSNSAGLSYL